MSDVVIKAEGISKRYAIGVRKPYGRVTESLVSLGQSLVRKAKTTVKGAADSTMAGPSSFWALKDVSFEIKRGDVVGVIGRNGAGKSTLLKVLSRITQPTEGYGRIVGRVGSLLEVGTGFHPELTGRENIYMNGAILGMQRWEINKKFDDIVEFAEISKFIDTAVKYYSSGMYTRLAFAVAAHLEPEILIVDEVLAVGDAQFQKKCLGKMKDVAGHGRTVLFVSHNLNAVASLCNIGIYLQSGRLKVHGPIDHVLAQYAASARRDGGQEHLRNESFALHSVSCYQDGRYTEFVDCQKPFDLVLRYQFLKPLNAARMYAVLQNGRSEVILGTSDADAENLSKPRSTNIVTARITIPGALLRAGPTNVTIGADIRATRSLFRSENCVSFEVIDSLPSNESERHGREGMIAPLLPWAVVDEEPASA